MKARHPARGITALEVIVLLVVALISGTVLLVATGSVRRMAARMMDVQQIGSVQRSMAGWASNNQGFYPLPSRIDLDNKTVAELNAAKDTTANIFSLLIYSGAISTEIPISVEEVNRASIQMDDDYMFDNPSAAIDPANALWDPAFVADFTSGKIGNVSYAHVLPGADRAVLWKDTGAALEPVIGNRGPEITGVLTDAKGKVAPTFARLASNTFLIHGSKKSWEGNIAYNDGHVAFESRLNPAGLTYKNAADKSISDFLFYDEPDDATGLNAWMSIWTAAGDVRCDFKPIWD